MQNLWRKTPELFWQYPILWQPILVADALQWMLLWIRKRLVREIITFFSQAHHSVLGGLPDPSTDPSAAMKASIVTGLLSTGIYLLTTCLFMAALFITAKLVRICLEDKPLHLRAAFTETAQSCKRKILVLSIKILALFAAGTVLLVFVMLHMARRTTMSYGDMGYIFGSILTVGIAYLLTPSIVAALAPIRLFTSKTLSDARLIAMLGAAASDLIGLFAQRGESSFFSGPIYPSVLTQQLIGLIGSLFTAFPYIPVSIALSLVAIGSQSYAEATET